MKDILLVAANNHGTYRSAKVVSESLGIGLLAAIVEENDYTCEILDARMRNLSPKDASKNIDKYSVVGISLFSFEGIVWVKEFLSIIKEKNAEILVVAGGYASTLASNQIIEAVPEIDIVINGEGEQTLIEILNAYFHGYSFEGINGIVYKSSMGYRSTKKRQLIKNLDLNPFPKRYAQDFADENFEVLIEGSRGCGNNCTFCAVKPFFGKEKVLQWRGRSAQSLIDEIIYIRHVYPNSRRIRFVDPDFLGVGLDGINRAVEFCEMLKKNNISEYQFYCETRVVTVCEENKYIFEKLKAAGFVEIYLGIESGSEYILKTMNKGIKPEDSIRAVKLLNEWGFDVVYGFMMFTPWSKYEDILKNLEFLKKIGDVQFDKLFHKLEIIPNTPSVNYTKNRGLLLEFNSSGYYNYKFESHQIEQLWKMWIYLQEHEIEFLEQIWYLYKDLKLWKQAEGITVKKYLDKLTNISIDIFESLCLYCKDNNIMLNEKNKDICNILEEYRYQLENLESQVNKKYCFPRNKMPGGA